MRLRLGLVPLLVAALLLAAACGDDPGDAGAEAGQPASLVGYERVPTPQVGALSLPRVHADGTSEPFTFRARPDSLLVVYFGYTSCPDVCPTTLADISLALAELGDRAGSVELAMATIDPEVDTPDVLAAYVGSFVDGAIALRTEDDPDLAEVADVFGVAYGKDIVDGRAEVFHTGSTYVVDDDGNLVLTWPFGVSSDDIAADLALLFDRAEATA